MSKFNCFTWGSFNHNGTYFLWVYITKITSWRHKRSASSRNYTRTSRYPTVGLKYWMEFESPKISIRYLAKLLIAAKMLKMYMPHCELNLWVLLYLQIKWTEQVPNRLSLKWKVDLFYCLLTWLKIIAAIKFYNFLMITCTVSA